MYRLICHDNKFDLFMTLIYVVHTFLGKKLNQYVDIVCNWCDKFVLDLKSYGKVKSEALPEFTSDFSLRKWFDTIIDNNLVKSFKELLLNLVGLKFFSRTMASKFIALLGPAKPVSLIEFSRNALETVEEFISFAVNYRRSGSFIDALSQGDPCVAFLEKTYALTLKVRNVYLGDDANFKALEKAREGHVENTDVNFETTKVAAKDFVIEVRNAVIEGESISKRVKVSSAFKARLYLLKEIRDELMIRMRSKNRRAPFGLIIHGDPSIGKSSILVHIYKLWAKYKGLDYSRDLVYDRNPKSDYWTNHDPLSQPIIHYPELGSVASNIVKTKGDETIDEMLMVADTQPFSAEMADVNEKGKCMIMPELLVIDCNDPKMNLEYTNNNPAAIRRRFVYIEAKVKPQYANLTALDESKIPEDLEHKMDLWDFKIYKQIPNGIRKSEILPLIEGRTDIFGLSSKMMELFEEHDHKQDGFGKAVAENIEKYLVTSEAQTSPAADMLLYAICVMLFIFPWYTLEFILIYLFGTIGCEYYYQQMSFQRFMKIKILTFISRHIVEYKMRSYMSDFYDSLETCVYFSYFFGKSFFKEDARYYEYKLRFNNFSLMKKCSISLLFFTITISFLKILISLFQIVSEVTSEGNIIDSSGKYTEATADVEIARVEKLSQVSFPLAKKKLGSDKDYDVVENILPRYVSEKRNKENPTEIYNSIKRNIRYIKINYNGQTFNSIGVGICQDIIMMNKHCIPGDNTQLVSSCRKEWASNVKYCTVNLSDVIIVSDDVVLFRFYGELFRDIKFTLTDVIPTEISMKGMFQDKKRRVRYHKKSLFVKNILKDYILTQFFEYDFPGHSNGDCGSPLMITVGKQSFMVGIHSGGHDVNVTGYATVINKSNIFKAIAEFNKDCVAPVNSEGSLRLPKGSIIKPVTSRSPLLFEDSPGLGVIGSISNYSMITPKSQLIESPLINDIENMIGVSPYRDDGNLKYLPPLMKSKRVNNKFIAPYNNWIKKVGVTKKELSHDLMKITSVSLACHLIQRLRKVGVDKLTPYSLEVAQNGYPENFYIRSMKNSTSGGFLLPGKKSKYNSPVELSFKKDSVMPNFEVKEQVLEILNAYENGECSHDIVGAQLKDEPRAYEKVVSGKTRVFAMSSYPMTLVNRMYLMPFYALMCEHRELFGTRVGINMHSEESQRMYDSLVGFSPLIMEGDYGGYDTSMPIGIGLMANSVVEICLKQLGYNDFANKIVKGILSDNLFPTISMEGNLIMAAGFQPSGKYATAEDNSLRGLILLYYAYIVMCTSAGKDHSHNLTTKFGVNDFFKYIRPETYGDDMLAAVKEEISEYFNNITYSKFVEEVYGMEFTTADKHAHTSKFVDATKISFLKRSFVFNPMLNRKVAVLDKDSFVKSLSYILPSKEVDIETQIVETSQSVLREYFFYCSDLKEFEERRQLFISILLKHVSFDIQDLEKIFPKGEDLLEQYKL
jgi:hypothetical protein